MKLIRRLLIFLMLCILLTGAFIGYRGYDKYHKAIEAESVEAKVREIKSLPSYTHLQDLPQTYLNAVVAVEDKRFYKHPGIDFISVCRAMKNDIMAGKLIEGGSTITQQLAKNMYFNQERSLTRKIAECFMAVKLEKKYSKDQILELYVNSIYFGRGYYGISEASHGYFKIAPSAMNDYESTLLAGIPNAPSAYAPDVHPELAHKRQQKVLDSMVRVGFLTKDEASKIEAYAKGIG